jgi:hypothetical protein
MYCPYFEGMEDSLRLFTKARLWSTNVAAGNTQNSKELQLGKKKVGIEVLTPSKLIDSVHLRLVHKITYKKSNSAH